MRKGWKGRTIRDKGATEYRGRFQSRISFEGKKYYLGTFRTRRQANLAYLKKYIELLTAVVAELEMPVQSIAGGSDVECRPTLGQ